MQGVMAVDAGRIQSHGADIDSVGEGVLKNTCPRDTYAVGQFPHLLANLRKPLLLLINKREESCLPSLMSSCAWLPVCAAPTHRAYAGPSPARPQGILTVALPRSSSYSPVSWRRTPRLGQRFPVGTASGGPGT